MEPQPSRPAAGGKEHPEGAGGYPEAGGGFSEGLSGEPQSPFGRGIRPRAFALRGRSRATVAPVQLRASRPPDEARRPAGRKALSNRHGEGERRLGVAFILPAGAEPP